MLGRKSTVTSNKKEPLRRGALHQSEDHCAACSRAVTLAARSARAVEVSREVTLVVRAYTLAAVAATLALVSVAVTLPARVV